MGENFKHVVSKLENAKKRFHTFHILNNGLIFIMVFFLLIFALSVIESFGYLPVLIKTPLFYFSLILSGLFFCFYVGMPILRKLNLLERISNRKIEAKISSHFTQIKDKLLNLIELSNSDEFKQSLIVKASVDQKAEELIHYDFSKAISFNKVLIKLYILISIIVLFFSINFIFHSSLTNGLTRLLDYNTTYVPKPLFSFHLLNSDLNVKKGDSFSLKVKCEGRELPELLFLNISGVEYLMNRSEEYFQYEFNTINNGFSFYFTDQKHRSDTYEIVVLPNPVIVDFQVIINPPDYTGFHIDTLKNTGDFEVAYGSEISWQFTTDDVDYLSVTFQDDTIEMVDNSISKQLFNSENYKISYQNKFFVYNDLLEYNATIIKDEFPRIKLVQLKDSNNFSRFFFKGNIADDYGFENLTFNVSINQNDSIFTLPIVKNLNTQDFYYTFDFKYFTAPGDRVNYYFEVFDNDPFGGYKKVTSESFQFIFPNAEEINNLENSNLEDLEKLMNEGYTLSQEIKTAIDELKFKDFSDKSSNWEKQQLANEIVNKKNRLEKVIEDIQKTNKQVNQFTNSFTEEKTEIIEKQKEIEELLDEVLSDELKDLFKEFEQLAQDFQSDKLNEINENYDLTLEDLSKQLERNLEALKRMKVEQKFDRLSEFLSKLSKDEELNAEILNKTKEFENILEKETANKSKFNQSKKELETILELNNSLKKPLKFPSFDNEANKVLDGYKEILKNLSDKKKNKSIRSIRDNSQNLEQLSDILTNALQMNRKKQNLENLNDLKQLLDNLVILSLDQEDLLTDLNSVSNNDPLIKDFAKRQDELINQAEFVKDSLHQLSLRNESIGNVVNNELIELEISMRNSKEDLVNNRISSARRSEQYSITAINNIAVFLNEALKNLEEQMANSMPGDQMSDQNTQSGKQGMSMLKQAQEALKKQLQQMIEQMKSGDKTGMSKQLTNALSQQELMQKVLRDLYSSDEVGSSAKQQLKQIDRLIEESKVDIINNQLSIRTINRQNLILDRLLRAENAEIERDVEEKRESKTAEENFYSNPAEFFEYNNKETKFDDLLFRNEYQLKKFYDTKYKEYLNQLNNKD